MENGDAQHGDENQLQVGKWLNGACLGCLVGLDQQPVRGDCGNAKQAHPAPIGHAHRFPEPDARCCRGQRADCAGPEKRYCRAVFARHIAGKQAVKREHEGREQRDQGGGREHLDAGLQDDQHPRKADADCHPPPPAHALAQHRARQGGDQQRVADKNRVGFNKAENDEGLHRHDHLEDEQQRAPRLHQRLRAARGGAHATGLARCQCHHEKRECPVPDHHHHIDVVSAREVARDAVLQREDQRCADHHCHALTGVLWGHARVSSRPAAICRLRPCPGRRVTANPAACKARRTWPAAV